MSYINNFDITEDDLLTSDKFLNLINESPKIDYIKSDFFHIGQFNWRGRQHPFKPLGNDILITGHADYPINKDIHEIVRKFYKKWFAINIEVESSDLISIPLGLTNNTNETHLHPIYGNPQHILHVRSLPLSKENLCYMNFGVNTYPQERTSVYNMFKDSSWVLNRPAVITNEGRIQYLTDIAKSKFVLCPRGNGIDTHRLWETLYVRSIPIVKRHITHKGMEDLPILFIDDWSEVTPEFLEKKYTEMTSRVWNFNKLKFSWWRSLIIAS